MPTLIRLAHLNSAHHSATSIIINLLSKRTIIYDNILAFHQSCSMYS